MDRMIQFVSASREAAGAPQDPLSAPDRGDGGSRPERPVLELNGVGKIFGRHPPIAALSDVSLIVNRGESVAVVGPSGSGKTTLLRCINFLVPYDSGRVLVNGRLVGYREHQGRLVPDTEPRVNEIRKRIGMVFQRFNLFPHRTVLGNLLEGPLYVLKVPRTQAVQRAKAALELVGLTDKIDAYPGQLSGGQQQRVAIARALCMEPELMLFDEVTSALDPELVGEVLAVIRRLAQQGMTMVIVTHEMAFARDVADRVVFMEAGRIVVDQPAADFFMKPATPRIEAFLSRFAVPSRSG
jgi:polar amino acid transport system ATP-binding protein